MQAPRPTAGAPRTDLEELLAGVRRELGRREESATGEWVEETAHQLARGDQPGWYFAPADGGGLAFYAVRGRDAYGHVHAGDAPRAVESAVRLATELLDRLPESVAAANLGFTGLNEEAEGETVRRLAERPGSTVIERWSLERALAGIERDPVPPVPTGLRTVPAADVTVEALADLDRRAFGGTVEALLVGSGPDDHRHVLAAMLEGRLGRFLDQASIALLTADPPRLVGAVLAAEQSIRRAVMIDLMVDPELRRQGLGRFLVAWNLRALRALGYDAVRLWVAVANQPARALYDRFGFRRTGTATLYRWDRPPAAQPHTAR